jgi:hypothetical protein
MKVISIYSEIDKDNVFTSLERGDVLPCNKAVPPLKKSDIGESTRIVAQMGLEPVYESEARTSRFWHSRGRSAAKTTLGSSTTWG